MQLNIAIFDTLRDLGIADGAIYRTDDPEVREIRLPGFERPIADIGTLAPIVEGLVALPLIVTGYGAGVEHPRDDFLGATITIQI